MAMLIVLMSAALAAAAWVSLLVLAVAMRPTRGERLLRTLAEFGRTRGRLIDDRGPSWDERLRLAYRLSLDSYNGLERLQMQVVAAEETPS